MAEAARETQAEEVAAAPDVKSTLARAAFAPGGALTPASMQLLQRSAGNRAATAQLARQPAGTGKRMLARSGPTMKLHQVMAVVGAWVIELDKHRAENGMDSDAVDAEARRRAKAQVGPANWAMYEAWDNATETEAMKSFDQPQAAAAPDPEAQMAARHDALWKETAAMRAEVVQTEYLAQKLNFGHGAKGTVARITAGGYTGMYAVGARTVSSVAEHAPILVLSAVGLVLGSEYAERKLVEHGQAIKREGEEMGDDVYTGVQLAGGDMQKAYDETRAPYNKYSAALLAFAEASSQFQKDGSLDGMNGFTSRSRDISTMEAKKKEMADGYHEYAEACARLGIKSSAKRLDTLGDHIVQGNTEMVSTAVTMGVPEAGPGVGELVKVLKPVEGASVKAVEREAELAAGGAVKQEAKAEAKALVVGAEAEAKTGMPVKNQQAVADACKKHDVIIDVRGTNPEAPRRLTEGHLPKPEAIKAKSINQLDTYIGFRKEDVGLVGYKKPTPPVQGEVPPELWEAVNKRYAERAAEYDGLAPDMANLERAPGARDQFAAVGFDKQVKVDGNGVVRVVEGEGGQAPRGFTGDHDLFQVRNPDGTPVSGDKYTAVMTDLAQQGVGVEHGAHMRWDVPPKPNVPGKDPTKGFQGIADKHMPGAGGEDLYRFTPDGSITPVRADPGSDTLGAARAAAKGDKAAVVPDVDKTVQGIGPQR